MKQKNKNIFLVVGFLVSLLVIYNVAISDTLATKQKLESLKDGMRGLENMPQIISNLNQKEKFLDSILESNNIKGTSVQNNLLRFLNGETNGKDFKIIGFEEPHEIMVDGAIIVSYSFRLEGGYEDILKTIYSLEQENTIGTIRHIDFLKERDFRKRKDYLRCTVILETLVSE